MDPISLAEMDRVQLMNRVDTKYVTNDREIETLLQNVRSEYRVLTIENVRLSAYTTLYFDSQDHAAYIEHHNGRLNRQKLRMRKYASTGSCFLEVKRKNNKGRTDKRRIPIEAIEEKLSDESSAFVESLVGAHPDLRPQLWTYFSRITLVDRERLERATFDYDLEFSCGAKRERLPGVVIAEIKQERDDRGSAIRRQLRRQVVRPLRVSKYCLGISLLKPELKSNRFKSKLRAVQRIA
ncbi:polyphosphate polymerase domain-containing protein [Pirellulales bacterium]|nr:polyphosphate polymerase domain-containing protein [Pirellulales bacterium]